MRLLIASCIRQKPEILKEFLESLDELQKPKGYEYFFILSDLEKTSRRILADWTHGKPVEKETMDFNEPYITDEDTHHWTPELVSNVIEMKNRILEKAKDYDYLLFVDSDTYLHPETLTQLLSREKDIITEISWTKWYADDDRILPNAWFFDNYSFPPDGLKRLSTKPLVKVGGFGGLYLISKKALEAGVSFSRVERVPEDWGEDRHFAVRAQKLGFDLWCDTTLPSFHIYRMSDLPRLQEWKKNLSNRGFEVLDCRWGTHSEREKPEFVKVIDELDTLTTVFPRWSRAWEYPYAYLNSALEKDHRVLDAGCGESPFKYFLESRCGEVHCIDKDQIEIPENSGVIFKRSDLSKISYPDDYFDKVFCISVLEHTEKPPMKYIREMLRVLKVGGTLHLTIDFNRWSTQWKFKKPEILTLCQQLGIELPPQPDDLLKSEDHPEGKTVGEGLSVLGFTLLKTDKIEVVQEEKYYNGVLISIPNTGQIKTELVSVILNIAMRSPQFIGVDMPQGMPVDSNRNNAVKRFISSRFEWLLFIDSDIVPPADVVERLLRHKKKIVSALCWSSMGGEKGEKWEQDSIPYPTVMERDEKSKGWHVDRERLGSPETLISVDAVGMACILIHREVLESMSHNWFRLTYGPDGICDGGEDFTFCMKAKEIGYEIWADKSVQCSHYKAVDLKKFNELLAKTARGEPFKKVE